MAPRGPKMAPKCSKMAPGSSKMAPRGLKTAPRCPQDGPKSLQEAPRWRQDGAERPQDGPKMAPRWPQEEQQKHKQSKICTPSRRHARFRGLRAPRNTNISHKIGHVELEDMIEGFWRQKVHPGSPDPGPQELSDTPPLAPCNLVTMQVRVRTTS